MTPQPGIEVGHVGEVKQGLAQGLQVVDRQCGYMGLLGLGHRTDASRQESQDQIRASIIIPASGVRCQGFQP